MSDRIAVMSLGKVKQIGTPIEIYERPSNRFVADFIGESNFLDGTVKSNEKDRALVFVPALNMELTGLNTGNVSVGEKAVLSIRPEKIRLADKKVMNTNCIEGTVTNTTYIGSDTHVYLDVHGTPFKVLEQNKISSLDPQAYYTRGQKVWLSLFPENTLVLADI
jgi:spermidine/putrescine transport system ATP-binding protein